MGRNGKDKFYRYLNLDEDSKKILKWYKRAVEDLKNDKYIKEDNLDES